jgi:hypothetical protein
MPLSYNPTHCCCCCCQTLLLQVTAPQWADDPQLVGWLRGTLNLPLPWLHSAQVRDSGVYIFGVVQGSGFGL